MKTLCFTLFMLASTGFATAGLAADNFATDKDMVEEAPVTGDESDIVADTPDPSEIDPHLPITPPVNTRDLDGNPIETAPLGTLTTGVCLEDGEASGAVTREQCAEAGGVWHETIDTEPAEKAADRETNEDKGGDSDTEVPSDDLDKEDR